MNRPLVPASGVLRRLQGLGWPLLAAVGSVLPGLVVLASGHTLVWRDTAQLNAPLRPLIGEALRSFHVPGWNPYEGAGQPLFGQLLTGVLHPVSLLLAPFTDSMDAMIVLLVATAGAGAWVAARSLGSSRNGALAAGLAFGLSGFVLGTADNTCYLMSTATGPWAVAGLVRSPGRGWSWATGALGVAALALAGDPGSVFAFGLIGLVLVAVTWGWRSLLPALAACVAGLGVAAIQLYPSWTYMADTARGHGHLDPGDLRRWALAPWRALELAAPGFFVGMPRSYVAPVFAALDGATPDRFPFVPSVFVGAATLALAEAGLATSRSARWLAGLAVAFLWFSLGHRAGSQQLLSWVPVWGVLRFWEKMVGPLTLCVAMASSAGVDALAAGRAPAVRRAALTGLGAAFALLVLTVSPLGPTAFGIDPATAALAASRLEIGLVHVALALAALAATTWLLADHPALAAATATGIVWLQSTAACPFALHPGSRAALAAHPPDLRAAPPGARIAAPLGCDYDSGQGDLDAIDLLNICERRSGRPSTNAPSHVDAFPTYSSLTPSRWDLVAGSGGYFWPIARRLGTTHVLSRLPRSELDVRMLTSSVSVARGPVVLDDGALLVWELPHRPWASFASSAIAAPDLGSSLAALAREIDSGGSAVVVETSGPLGALSPGTVTDVARRADEVVVLAESDGEALLVVNDAWGWGWRAWIDGREADILPADVLARAIRWPAGRHELRMAYSPPGLPAGVAITTVSLLLVMLGAFLWRGPGAGQGRTS